MRALVSLLFASLLWSCSGIYHSTGPVPYAAFFNELPTNYQWSGKLEIQQSDKVTSYLVALNTSQGQGQMALLTGHGMPLFSAVEQDTRTRIQKQLGLEGYPGPGELLSYLGLAFSRTSYDSRINVTRHGSAPWYDNIVVQDMKYNIEIRIHTMEWQNVSPE
ncbi:hypothetical protein F0M18_11805 [Pseudohalioglobus sediminis]|uniref:Outer-membrane lipoprotein LolB n=1 Tax=Pseudohalioglobus sediminis TaxID=2606449 RepID=A0A5B0WTT8_9GAMM|nr:hypothetical protein [Pseudohalioglobus sediminis]KAA1190492.1 hypothetical protein F0M18_11805 [Pseudohalioglobus sediminis]